MKSIYFKNFLISAGMVIASFFIVAAAFVVLCRSFVINDKREAMSSNAQEIVRVARTISQDGEGLSSWDLRMYLTSVARITGNHVFITDSEGTVMSCSDIEVICEHIGRQMSMQTMIALHSNGELNILTDLNGFYPVTHYVIATPITLRPDSEPVGYVFIGSDSSTIMDAWGTFVIVFYATTVAVLLVAVIMAYFTSKHQAKPINQMVSAAHSFARGDFSARIEDDGREDEIGELTHSFNAMAEALEVAEQQRQEFISNVSHELKTPMTAISGFADGILDGTIPPESQNQYLSTISSETKRLARLVRRMLDVSQLQASTPSKLHRSEFDVSELLLRTLLNFEQKINQKGLDVDVQIPEERMMVLADEDAINQVIYNLLDNAIKFAEQGTVIGLSLWKQGGRAYTAVRNTGETIPESELPLIFDRFHKTDRSRSQDRDGVGLGLYIVKSIINNHDQDIFVTSKDGVTEFVFTLAIAPKQD